MEDAAAPRARTGAVRARSLEVLAALERSGLLLRQDKQLPSVVTLLAGEPLSGSWWSHPDSRLMFHVLSDLADHPDVLVAKLLFAKDTFVHRRLWPAFLAVVIAREPWQVARLPTDARHLLTSIDGAAAPVRASGPATKALVARLLVHATDIHTEQGHHQTATQSWMAWQRRAGVLPLGSVDEARRILEEASRCMGAPPEALPWMTRRHSRATPRAEHRLRPGHRHSIPGRKSRG